MSLPVRVFFYFSMVLCGALAVANFIWFAIGGALLSLAVGVWCLLMEGVVVFSFRKTRSLYEDDPYDDPSDQYVGPSDNRWWSYDS